MYCTHTLIKPRWNYPFHVCFHAVLLHVVNISSASGQQLCGSCSASRLCKSLGGLHVCLSPYLKRSRDLAIRNSRAHRLEAWVYLPLDEKNELLSNGYKTVEGKPRTPPVLLSHAGAIPMEVRPAGGEGTAMLVCRRGNCQKLGEVVREPLGQCEPSKQQSPRQDPSCKPLTGLGAGREE